MRDNPHMLSQALTEIVRCMAREETRGTAMALSDVTAIRRCLDLLIPIAHEREEAALAERLRGPIDMMAAMGSSNNVVLFPVVSRPRPETRGGTL